MPGHASSQLQGQPQLHLEYDIGIGCFKIMGSGASTLSTERFQMKWPELVYKHNHGIGTLVAGKTKCDSEIVGTVLSWLEQD